jgi:heptosyltransferase I
MASRILIVRLGALGDLVHALPTLAAIRQAWPDATIDWLVDRRYAGLLTFVSGFDRAIVIDGGAGGWWRAIREMRATPYDAALDLQGLIKSAALARLSGAGRVIGFAPALLRESAARFFHTESVDPGSGCHVVHKNLSLVGALGLTPGALQFPLDAPLDERIAAVLPAPDVMGARRFAVVNPGAGWPNKRWNPDRFGAVAGHLRARHRLMSFVTWGPGEQELAEAVVRASGDAARFAPATGLGDMIALLRRAALFVGGDTGPLQIAAAVGTPIVSIFGPTSPARNGSWHEADEALSRFEQCVCHHKRRCSRATPCIDDIPVEDVVSAVDRRLAAAAAKRA